VPVNTTHLDTLIEIETPEHLAFSLRIAGPIRRFFAWFIDMVVRFILLITLYFLYSFAFSAINLEGVGTGLLALTLFVFDWGYFVLWEIFTGGRSPGKIALKLRVLRNGGLPLNWQASVLRNLVRAVDFDLMLVIGMGLPPFGAMVMAFDSRFRRLGDMAAGTIVVIDDEAKIRNTPSLKPSPGLKASMPSILPLSREEMEAIELFVHRTQMSDARRDELADIVAPEFRERLAISEAHNQSDLLAAIWAATQEDRSGGAK